MTAARHDVRKAVSRQLHFMCKILVLVIRPRARHQLCAEPTAEPTAGHTHTKHTRGGSRPLPSPNHNTPRAGHLPFSARHCYTVTRSFPLERAFGGRASSSYGLQRPRTFDLAVHHSARPSPPLTRR